MTFATTFAPEEITRAEVDASTEPMVLEFGNNWCSWCQAAQPHIRGAFAHLPQDAQHIKIADGRGRPLGRSFHVKLWPTLIFLRDGQEVARVVRPGSQKEVEQALAQLNAPQRPRT